jgi:hypothetical protein
MPEPEADEPVEGLTLLTMSEKDLLFADILRDLVRIKCTVFAIPSWHGRDTESEQRRRERKKGRNDDR